MKTETVDPSELVEKGAAEAKELTSGRIPAGQIIEEITYDECQFTENSDRILIETNGCEVYELLWTCQTTKQLWWVRAAGRLRMSWHWRTYRAGYKRIVVCPNGIWRILPGFRTVEGNDSTYDHEPPISTPGLPPIWFPPMEQPAP